MNEMLSCDESDAESTPTDMLEDIHDIIQSHPIINRKEAHYKICDQIKQRKVGRKG